MEIGRRALECRADHDYEDETCETRSTNLVWQDPLDDHPTVATTRCRHSYGPHDQKPLPLLPQAVLAAWQQLGAWLEETHQFLDELDQQQEHEGMVTSAILRVRHDLAAAVGSVADELEQQSLEERRAWAQACATHVQTLLDDLNAIQQQQQQQQQQLELGELTAHQGCWDDGKTNVGDDPTGRTSLVAHSRQRTVVNEQEFMAFFRTTSQFLRDVEASLLLLDPDTAQELAEASLVVAQLTVESLQSLYSQVTPNRQALTAPSSLSFQQQRRRHATQPEHLSIEILPDDLPKDSRHTLETASPRDKELHKQPSRVSHKRGRMRVLWPPLGPAVLDCLLWTQNQAFQRPLVSLAVACTLWPWALVTVLVATPLVVWDAILQATYQYLDDTTLVVGGLERGAAQLYHTGRLASLTAKLTGRSAWYIVQQQVDRHGGLGGMAHCCTEWVVDRVTHPVETLHDTWHGMWGVAHWIQCRVEEVVVHRKEEELYL